MKTASASAPTLSPTTLDMIENGHSTPESRATLSPEVWAETITRSHATTKPSLYRLFYSPRVSVKGMTPADADAYKADVNATWKKEVAKLAREWNAIRESLVGKRYKDQDAVSVWEGSRLEGTMNGETRNFGQLVRGIGAVKPETRASIVRNLKSAFSPEFVESLRPTND